MTSVACRCEHRKRECLRGGRQCFRLASPDDNDVLIDDAGAGKRDRNSSRIATQTFAQIDSAILSKRRNGFPGAGVQRVQKVHHPGKNASALPIRPIREPSGGLCPLNAAVKLPKKLARRCVEGDDLLGRRIAVEHAIDNDGARLRAACFSRVEGPRYLQIFHIGAIDLRERRIVVLRQLTAIHWPAFLVSSIF